MDMQLFGELKSLCIAAGFARKGQAFFRIVGDGVLQVIKCKYERSLRGNMLSVGLFSMYGDLLPQWFTASGCIPRYSILNCAAQNNRPLVHAAAFPTQLDMLKNQVLPWLDSIDTQKNLVRAISRLDPRWNDSLKIGAYLACGQGNHAKKVLREILSQHDFARSNGSRHLMESNGMMFLRQEQEDDDLLSLLALIDRDDPDELHAYLMRNYERNMSYAKFCAKTSQKQP